MKIKNKRILKNGVSAGYVLQKDGTWKWQFLNRFVKKKGGMNIKEGRLSKLESKRIKIILLKVN